MLRDPVLAENPLSDDLDKSSAAVVGVKYSPAGLPGSGHARDQEEKKAKKAKKTSAYTIPQPLDFIGTIDQVIGKSDGVGEYNRLKRSKSTPVDIELELKKSSKYEYMKAVCICIQILNQTCLNAINVLETTDSRRATILKQNESIMKDLSKLLLVLLRAGLSQEAKKQSAMDSEIKKHILSISTDTYTRKLYGIFREIVAKDTAAAPLEKGLTKFEEIIGYLSHAIKEGILKLPDLALASGLKDGRDVTKDEVYAVFLPVALTVTNVVKRLRHEEEKKRAIVVKVGPESQSIKPALTVCVEPALADLELRKRKKIKQLLIEMAPKSKFTIQPTDDGFIDDLVNELMHLPVPHTPTHKEGEEVKHSHTPSDTGSICSQGFDFRKRVLIGEPTQDAKDCAGELLEAVFDCDLSARQDLKSIDQGQKGLKSASCIICLTGTVKSSGKSSEEKEEKVCFVTLSSAKQNEDRYKLLEYVISEMLKGKSSNGYRFVLVDHISDEFRALINQLTQQVFSEEELRKVSYHSGRICAEMPLWNEIIKLNVVVEGIVNCKLARYVVKEGAIAIPGGAEDYTEEPGKNSNGYFTYKNKYCIVTKDLCGSCQKDIYAYEAILKAHIALMKGSAPPLSPLSAKTRLRLSFSAGSADPSSAALAAEPAVAAEAIEVKKTI